MTLTRNVVMMPRWPWVSRAVFLFALDAERRRADAEHENAMFLRRELAELTARYHQLKLAGAVEVPPPVIAQPPAPRTPDPIRDAIREQVRMNPGMLGLSSYLSAYVRELREQNLSDEQIVVRLSKWESSEQWSAPVDSSVPLDEAADATEAAA